MTTMQMPQTLDGLCEFATVLIDAGYLNAATDVVYFFEKPHKWIKEYEIWQGCDEPEHGDNGWNWFIAKLEQQENK